jgi:serine phosphatase RsbU (regulator of sigma subunit)
MQLSEDQGAPPASAHKRRFHMFRSLRTRLRWSYALASVIPLALLGIILINTSADTQRENAYNSQQTAADWVAREVSASLTTIDDQLLSFGDRLRPDRSTAVLQEGIGRLRDAVPEIVDVAVLDTAGRERVHVSELRVFNDYELIDRSGDALVQYVLANGRVAQGSMIAQADGTPIYPSYAPIFSGSGRVIGAIRAEVDASRIARSLREGPLAVGSYAYLVRDDGALQIGATPISGSVTVPAPLPALLTAAEPVHEYASGQGEQVIGAWSPIAVQPARWWAVVEIPRGVAYAPSQRDTQILIAQIILVIVTTIAWGIYQSRRILQPIEELRQGAATIGAGDLSSTIPIHAEDEIGNLAREFNRMAEHLGQSRTEIEQQNQRLREGLALARDIQLGLLPSAPPGGQQIAIQARSIPAYEVGGDFYTYLAQDDSRMAVAIGDISGKGVGAALMMALASSTVEAHGRAASRPHDLLTVLNTHLAPRLKANRMNAALLYLMFDLPQRTMCVANAGMIAPLLIRNGRPQLIETAGLPLGAFAGARYADTEVRLEPGDLILLVSDGIVEARAPDGALFGFERLEELLANAQPAIHPGQLLDDLLGHVHAFMDGAEQHDDMTVVVIQPNLEVVGSPHAQAPAEDVVFAE